MLSSNCNVSYPLYSEKQCTYMSDQLACEKFGRKDLSYQNLRWQPNHCDLPRVFPVNKVRCHSITGEALGKMLVFASDSLNRGQWVSMVCLVEFVIPPALKSMHNNGSLITFKATVLMQTSDAEQEMRGRCSASQKIICKGTKLTRIAIFY
ncbi:hypothetical protein IFM89_009702 [Coptis chinensis]|uniref:Trichome birefringence-like N-terminal domain-containing protein n=1 Tax=Coptis chinensis TaxID=261450 RepID=A0A835LRF8_9MAGN|nr:hypothetical protein IFM89_009702 [Coptis chinensis]